MGKNAGMKVIAQTVVRRRFISARRKNVQQNAERRDFTARQKREDHLRHAGVRFRRACFNRCKSEGHGVTARQEGYTINVTWLIYKTRAVWPPQYAKEGKPALKCRSRSKYWKCSRSKYWKYRRGSIADLTRAVHNGRHVLIHLPKHLYLILLLTL